MDIENLLKSLVNEFKLDAIPEQNKDGIYQLNLPPDYRVNITSLEPGFFISSLLCPLPKEQKETLLIYLMKANLIGQGTGGGAIGVDPTEKHLTLSYHRPFYLSYRDFRETLEDFLNYLTYWQKEIPLFVSKFKLT